MKAVEYVDAKAPKLNPAGSYSDAQGWDDDPRDHLRADLLALAEIVDAHATPPGEGDGEYYTAPEVYTFGSLVSARADGIEKWRERAYHRNYCDNAAQDIADEIISDHITELYEATDADDFVESMRDEITERADSAVPVYTYTIHAVAEEDSDVDTDDIYLDGDNTRAEQYAIIRRIEALTIEILTADAENVIADRDEAEEDADALTTGYFEAHPDDEANDDYRPFAL